MKLLSVERKLQLIFVAMAAGLLAVIGFSLYAARAAAAADDARNLANLRLRTLDLTLSAMQDAETGQRGYLITGETPYLRPFEEAVQVIDQRFTRLHDLYQDDAPSQRKIAQMRELADRKLALLRETIQVHRERGSGAAIEIVRRGEGKTHMDHFRELVNELIVTERERYTRVNELSERGRKYGLIAYVVVFAVALAVSVVTYVALTRQLNEKRRLTERLEHEASHDALTLLPNRRFFLDWLRHAVAQSRRDNSVVGLLYMDLDGFKRINDEFGHAVGDQVLELAAARFRGTLRESDFLARLGGDEFAVVMPSAPSESDAARLAERLIASLETPLLPFLKDHPVGTSVGIAFYPADAGDHASLVKAADAAMYAAKRGGKRQHRLCREMTPAA